MSPSHLDTPESLNYVGQDQNGYVYLHHWATGWQQLVFPTHEDAARFLAARHLDDGEAEALVRHLAGKVTP